VQISAGFWGIVGGILGLAMAGLRHLMRKR
jgi:hypothetical protein